MTIYGVSQSSGVERRLNVERGGEGVVLTIIDHASGAECARVMMPVDSLLSAITDPAPGGSTIEGTAPPHQTRTQLAIEVRRNEVLLQAHANSAAATDVAIGFDDFQDALEGAFVRD